MKIKTIFSLLAATAMAIPLSIIGVSSPAEAQVNVYSTPGYHQINGREWYTTCSQYSSNVVRCTTNIKASQVKVVGGKYQSVTGWVFNNMTYLPSPRASWGTNPLARTTSWTANDGRKWRTECDTAVTGRNGCRSYNMATVIEVSGKGFKKSNKWVFNNMVTFSTSPGQAVSTPPPGSNPSNPPAQIKPTCSTGKTSGNLYRNAADEDCLLKSINYERTRAGLAPLVRNTKLDTVARNWSMVMAKASGTSAFEHNPNYGSQVRSVISNVNAWGENIAYTYADNSGENTHEMFMNSSGHKANIMNPKYNTVGLGVICESNDLCWTTEDFARS